MQVTVRQIAERAKITRQAVKEKAKKERWPIGGHIIKNHQKTKTFKTGEIPYLKTLFGEIASSGLAMTDKTASPPCPVTPSGQVHLLIGQGLSNPAPTSQDNLPLPLFHVQSGDSPAKSRDTVPEHAKQIALARIDLLRLWEDYRSSHKELTTAEADKEFTQSYNSGLLYNNVYQILGKVSVGTLYRWKADLNGSGDWRDLVPQYFLKENNLTQLTQEEATTFMRFLLHPNKIKVGTAVRLTHATFANKGLQIEHSHMSFRRFADWFRRNHYDRWILMREGQKALKDKVEPFIVRDPSLLNVGDVLVADGHRLNFQVINPFTGKPCRAVLVGYIDWKSYDLAGYEIMVEEHTQCIASALRNSVIRLGFIPKITYQDNGKAFKARFFTSTESLEESGIYGLFGRLGIIAVFAQPYNARAKIIERWFKEFSDTFERLLPSFTGTSIEDKPAWMLRNEKLHKALHKEYIPTIEETIQLIEMWLQFHRSQPCPHVKGKTIGEVFDEGTATTSARNDRAAFNIQELDDLMMAIRKSTITRNGIRFLNADYYDDNLYGLREEVMIKYSLFDLSQVKVFSVKGEFLCTAKRVPSVHPMAYYLGDPKDLEEFKQQISVQKRVEKRTIKGVREMLKLTHDAKAIDTALPWQQIVEVAPRVIEKIEKENINLPAVEERIPEEAIRSSEVMKLGSSEATIKPFFREMYERYEYLISNGINSEEDRRWIEEYKKTEEYRMLYEVIPAQQQTQKLGSSEDQKFS